MTQRKARINLDSYEDWVMRHWEYFDELMRQVVRETRSMLITQLQMCQLRDFDNEH